MTGVLYLNQVIRKAAAAFATAAVTAAVSAAVVTAAAVKTVFTISTMSHLFTSHWSVSLVSAHNGQDTDRTTSQ